MINIFIIIFMFLGILWFGWQYKNEKRSLWAGISFVSALIGVLLTLSIITVIYPDSLYTKVFTVLVIVFALIIFIFPVILIISLLVTGFQLVRREGAGLSHMLSLGAGFFYIAYLVVWPMLENIMQHTVYSYIYFYLSFCLSFTIAVLVLYTLTNILNLIKNPWKDYRHIIVLGGGLKNGREVTPLLASRVDKGIEILRGNKGSTLILSGGQGPDEQIPEGEAMKNYAVQQGVDESDIIVEDKSVSTKENLMFSKGIIDGREAGNIIVVTSRYHVLRALMLAKRLNIPCDGRGSKTRLYFSINAFIREWIAYLYIWKKTYIIVLITAFVLTVITFIINHFFVI